ncbi:MAG TPA: Flp family type IVb pilin [Allosphingosinicella sp.]|jgi:pilus assembly protein Flp/PilA
MGKFWKLVGDERGATAVEYALILSLIVLALIGGLTALGTSRDAMWTGVSEKVEEATN